MNVSIDVIGSTQHYLIDPSVKVRKIFEQVANKLHLDHKTRDGFFGIQGFHQREGCMVWLAPSDCLIDAIKKGLCFTPVLRLYLRVHSFPANFHSFHADSAAMHLFFKQTCERWYDGYRADSPLELVLLTLHLLVKNGPLPTIKSIEQGNVWTEVIASNLNTRGDANLGKKAGMSVAHLWNLFGQTMSFNDAIFNYMNILSSSGYPYETIRFSLRNYLQKKPTDLEVHFRGIELSEFNWAGQMERRFVPWSCIRHISQRGPFISVKLFDESLSVLKWWCPTQHMAKHVHDRVISCHRVYLTTKDALKTSSRIQLRVCNVSYLFDAILMNLTASMQQCSMASASLPLVKVQNKVSVLSVTEQLSKIIDQLGECLEDRQGEFTRDGTAAESLLDCVRQLYAMSAAMYEKVMPLQDECSSMTFGRPHDRVRHPEVEPDPILEKDRHSFSSVGSALKFELDADLPDFVANADDCEEDETVDRSDVKPSCNHVVCTQNCGNFQQEGSEIVPYGYSLPCEQADLSSRSFVAKELVQEDNIQSQDHFDEEMQFYETQNENVQNDEQMENFEVIEASLPLHEGDGTGSVLSDIKDLLEVHFAQEQMSKSEQWKLLDKAVQVMEEDEIVLKPEHTRRRRLATLRLSLFEH